MSSPTKITNPRRRKRIEEFVDKDHKVMGRYYDLLDEEITPAKLKKEMKKLIEKDPDFYDSYLIVAEILKSEGKEKEARKLLYTTYEKALKRIVDKNGNFPEVVLWGWLENRHLIRTIDAWAWELWEEGKTEGALEIFRELLQSNPNDNIGARYNILAIRLGLDSDYEKVFAIKGEPGLCDALKAADWFDKHSPKFPEEFSWWFKWTESDQKE